MSEEKNQKKIKRRKKRGPDSDVTKRNINFPKIFSLDNLIDSHKPKVGKPKKNPLERIQTLWGGKNWKKRLLRKGWNHCNIASLNELTRDMAFEESDLKLLAAPDTKRMKILTAGLLEADYYSQHFIEHSKPVVFRTVLTKEQVKQIYDTMDKKKFSKIHIRHEFFKNITLEVNEITCDISMNIEEVGFDLINDIFPHYVVDAKRKEEIEKNVQLEEKRREILQAQGIIDVENKKWNREKKIKEMMEFEEKARIKEEKIKAKEEQKERERKEKKRIALNRHKRYLYKRNKGKYKKNKKESVNQ